MLCFVFSLRNMGEAKAAGDARVLAVQQPYNSGEHSEQPNSGRLKCSYRPFCLDVQKGVKPSRHIRLCRSAAAWPACFKPILSC